MAEGLARHLMPDDFTAQSAGSVPSEVRAQAIAVMAEAGIDITQQWSKGVDDIDASSIDYVITLCAEESCPVTLHHAVRLHWPVFDPAGHDHKSKAEQLQDFRQARDIIRKKLEAFFEQLP